MLYQTLKNIAKGIFCSIYRIRVFGLEHVPQDGAVIYCSNHIHNFDPILVGISSKRTVRFMAKEELFHIPLLGKIIHRIGSFPVKRGEGDKQSLRTGLQILKNNEVLGIFPEGTRSETGELGKGHAGSSFFAVKSQAPVIPIAIKGNYRLFSKMTITFGTPLDLSQYSTKELDVATEITMQAIYNLLQKEE